MTKWLPVFLSISVALTACEESKKEAEKPPAEGSAAAGKATTDTPKDTTPDTPKVELLAKAVERRLHADRAESSSFLWTDWNRFQENYHPLYILDDDPKTAWVEGAAGDGEGEWIKVHVTKVAEATKVRLRLRNGYHKSASLHKKNARAKKLTVVLHPSGKSEAFDLEDNMEWQTIELAQDAGDLESIEMRVDGVYKGTKYKDLCLSDVEMFVTARTPENPEFEKKKLAKVLAWKKERVDAAKMFKSKAAESMPIGNGYVVTKSEKVAGLKGELGEPLKSTGQILSHAIKTGVGDKATLEGAKKALDGKFADWVPVEISVKDGRKLPPVDGLYRPDSWELAEGGTPRRDAFAVPGPGKLEFLTSNRLSSFESTAKTTFASALAGKAKACKRPDKRHFYYFRPKAEMGKSGGVLRRLLVVECGQVEERDGYYGYAGFQLLEYDETGKLAHLISPNSVTQFEWSANSKVSGGKRIRTHYNRDVLTDGLKVAKK